MTTYLKHRQGGARVVTILCCKIVLIQVLCEYFGPVQVEAKVKCCTLCFKSNNNPLRLVSLKGAGKMDLLPRDRLACFSLFPSIVLSLANQFNPLEPSIIQYNSRVLL